MTKLKKNELIQLILLFSLLAGGRLRFLPSIYSDFPVNDGGMFYTMMNDLRTNGYLLPETTSYNHLNLPFAYPPLPLYAGAALSDLSGLSLLTILRWLPPLVNTLCVLAFYFLARELLADSLKGALATSIYALTPNLMSWLSMGGGLTRGFGHLFLLLTLLHAHRLFTHTERRPIAWTVLFGSLTILSHPEAAVFALSLPIYFWLMKSRSPKKLLDGVLVAFGVLALAGPWLGWMIERHGVSVILSALQTGGHGAASLLHLFNFNEMTGERYLDLIGVLGFLGMISLIAKRDYFIPGMLVLIFFVQPRSAYTVGNLPLALAGSLFLTEILFPALAKLTNAENFSSELFASRGEKVFLTLGLLFELVNLLYFGSTLSQNHVSFGERAAMQWIQENIPAESQFIVLTGKPDPVNDAVAEWFPALSQRKSLATLQGREWLLGKKFGEFLGHTTRLQACIATDLDCFNHETAYFGEFDYVYVSTGSTIAVSGFQDYVPIYTSADAVIFKYK